MGNFQQWFNKTYNIIKDTNMIVKCPKCGTVIPKDKEMKKAEEGVITAPMMEME